MRAIDRPAALTAIPIAAGSITLATATAGTAKPDSLPENLVEKAGSVVVGPRRRR
jgi:hypothetical protein